MFFVCSLFVVNGGNIRGEREKVSENVTNERWWCRNKVFVKKKVKEKTRIVTGSARILVWKNVSARPMCGVEECTILRFPWTMFSLCICSTPRAISNS